MHSRVIVDICSLIRSAFLYMFVLLIKCNQIHAVDGYHASLLTTPDNIDALFMILSARERTVSVACTKTKALGVDFLSNGGYSVSFPSSRESRTLTHRYFVISV